MDAGEVSGIAVERFGSVASEPEVNVVFVLQRGVCR